MQIALYIASLLCVSVGIAHSVLGEKYILIRLFRRDNLPKLFGGQEFTVNTIRFAWHITTVAWWGFAAILILLAETKLTPQNVSIVIAATFLITAFITVLASRGRHLAWPVFLIIGGIAAIFSCTQMQL
ncbi:MAG: hypothetical protein EOP47_11780 [Sphingobacteriaceae bacterium]|nr:MAG: hypothetical protein EOP47_11780 [Sphingobacteriaceae bacterium]